jgi:hypothetical protein
MLARNRICKRVQQKLTRFFYIELKYFKLNLLGCIRKNAAPNTPAMGSTRPDACPIKKLLARFIPSLLNGKDTATPSGKFWRPIPIAKAMAPPSVAEERLGAADPRRNRGGDNPIIRTSPPSKVHG